jgi:hypothetical protein
MSEMELAYHAMMGGSIYDCIKWIRLTSGTKYEKRQMDKILTGDG